MKVKRTLTFPDGVVTTHELESPCLHRAIYELRGEYESVTLEHASGVTGRYERVS